MYFYDFFLSKKIPYPFESTRLASFSTQFGGRQWKKDNNLEIETHHLMATTANVWRIMISGV